MTFPTQIIDELAAQIATITSVDQAVKRELRRDDPNCIVSVTGGEWTPESYEIGHQTLGAAHGPKTSFYKFIVALFVKGLGEEDTYALMNQITREIRDLVETQSNLRLNLLGMLETGSPARPETVRDMTVQSQKPGSASVEGTGDFAYFSVTELTVKVEA